MLHQKLFVLKIINLESYYVNNHQQVYLLNDSDVNVLAGENEFLNSNNTCRQ